MKPAAAICHGPYAFLSTRRAGNGEFAYKGYKITSWSDAEERVMETVMRGEIDKVEGSLREAGADMQSGVGEKVGAVTVDREVVSGGNPMAAATLGDKVFGVAQWVLFKVDDNSLSMDHETYVELIRLYESDNISTQTPVDGGGSARHRTEATLT
ncbi:unnamed protein product [Discula destructiva]